ncbi:MAG: TonB-dependent receptor plug domain-containing protein, partial [Polyangiales bacterium]
MIQELMRLALCLCLGLFVLGGTARAQDLVAPRVKSLPGIEVPAGVDVPEGGVVRVQVRIDPDGSGIVESCDAGRLLCDLVVDAMRRAEFAPATRDGHPVPSQVAVDLKVREPAVDEPPSETVLEPSAARLEKELVFSETAEVDARVQVPIKLELEGIRNIPGTLGEPFRTLALMPGTVPVANGQPYVYVRGAPPSGTSYLYDDIAIPLLFHSALGPATIQSGLIGGIELFSGVAPARYGGATGGVVSARARRFENDRVHGEADLRLIDVSALLNVPMPKEGSMTFAGRYGFPNLILGAIDVDADVDFWDYQYRTGVDMSPRSRFEVVALGGRDRSVFDASDPDERLAFDLQFHRFDARFVGRVKRWDFVGTMLYGYDFSEVEDASGLAVADARANLHRFGPRFWAIFGAPKAQLRIGGEMSALFGPVQCVGGVQNISTPCDEDFLEQENRRIIGGAFVDSNISALSWLDVSLGLR